MFWPAITSAVALSRSPSSGHAHLPVFGVFAAAGVVAALWLSQYTTQQVRLPSGRLWDAGMFGVLSAFFISRLFLVALNFAAFRVHPLLVLTQPSLTYGDMGLVVFVGVAWLKRHHLPLLLVADAWAAPALLLAGVLQLGHFVEGTDTGLPTHLPWAVQVPGDAVAGRVLPVQLYGAVGEFALCALLLLSLRRTDRHTLGGGLAARALFFSGLLSFFLGFLRQPYANSGHAWLDPAQIAALAGILLGLWLYRRSRLHSSSRPKCE